MNAELESLKRKFDRKIKDLEVKDLSTFLDHDKGEDALLMKRQSGNTPGFEFLILRVGEQIRIKYVGTQNYISQTLKYLPDDAINLPETRLMAQLGKEILQRLKNREVHVKVEGTYIRGLYRSQITLARISEAEPAFRFLIAASKTHDSSKYDN